MQQKKTREFAPRDLACDLKLMLGFSRRKTVHNASKFHNS